MSDVISVSLSQMGLLLDLSPDAALDDSGGNDEDLEAELFALIGGEGSGRGKLPGKKEGGKGEKYNRWEKLNKIKKF